MHAHTHTHTHTHRRGQTCWLHMQVVDVDLGTGVPHIRNLQALASPTATIWPQALFDLDFTGPSTACAGLMHSLLSSFARMLYASVECIARVWHGAPHLLYLLHMTVLPLPNWLLLRPEAVSPAYPVPSSKTRTRVQDKLRLIKDSAVNFIPPPPLPVPPHHKHTPPPELHQKHDGMRLLLLSHMHALLCRGRKAGHSCQGGCT